MNRSKLVVATLGLLAILTSALPAAAQPADAPPEPLPADAPPAAPAPAAATPVPAPAEIQPDRAVTQPPRYDVVRINAGLRVGYIPTSGFDAFADSDALTQFSVDATYPVLHQDRFVLGVGLGWDIGSRSDRVRGFDSSLTAHRLTVPIEGRWHFTPWLFGFGKLAPGAAAMLASLTDPSSPTTLKTTSWAFAADASVGASFLLGPRKDTGKRTPHFWVTPELGYSFTTDAPMNLSTGRADKDLLGSDENVRLASVALSGFFWRATIGTTF
jgi:hypothetical protein